MMMRQLVFAVGLAIVCAAPALAGDSREERRDIDFAQPFAKAFNDETVTMLFGFLRESLRFAAEGKPAPPPPAELAKRMQEAGETLKRESANAALGVLDEVEREMREALRERDGTSL